MAEYLSWVAVGVGHLTPANVDAVRAIVDAANDVHGYAHVRQASIAAVRDRRGPALDELTRRRVAAAAAFPTGRMSRQRTSGRDGPG